MIKHDSVKITKRLLEIYRRLDVKICDDSRCPIRYKGSHVSIVPEIREFMSS